MTLIGIGEDQDNGYRNLLDGKTNNNKDKKRRDRNDTKRRGKKGLREGKSERVEGTTKTYIKPVNYRAQITPRLVLVLEHGHE